MTCEQVYGVYLAKYVLRHHRKHNGKEGVSFALTIISDRRERLCLS